MAAVLEITEHWVIHQDRVNQKTFFLKQAAAPTVAFDLTNYAGEAQLRADYADVATAALATGTVQVVDAATGEISVAFDLTATLVTQPKGRWDLVISDGADSQKAAGTTWALSKTVTR